MLPRHGGRGSSCSWGPRLMWMILWQQPEPSNMATQSVWDHDVSKTCSKTEYFEVISFLEGYLDNSFDTIAGYGKNGAIVHYVAEVTLKRNIRHLECESMGLLSHPVSNFKHLEPVRFFFLLSAQAANAATLGAIPGAVCAMSESVASGRNQSQPRPGFLPFAGFRCAIRGRYHRCHSHPSCIPQCTAVYMYMVYSLILYIYL